MILTKCTSPRRYMQRKTKTPVIPQSARLNVGHSIVWGAVQIVLLLFCHLRSTKMERRPSSLDTERLHYERSIDVAHHMCHTFN